MDNLQIAMEAISLYQAQYDLVDRVWGYFSVVSLAVGGFVVSSEGAVKTLKEPLAIVLAYLVFSFGNHKALVAGQQQLEQLSIIAIDLAQKATLDISSFKPISSESVSFIHASFIAAVSIGVLCVAWFRNRAQK